METHVDKAELIRRMMQSYNEFTAAIAKLNEVQLTQPNAIGTWSIKDVIVHFIAWEQRTLREIEAAKRGEHIVAGDISEDAFNARFIAESQSRPTKIMLLAWGTSFRQLLNSIESLTDADFAPGSTVVAALGDSIDGAVANNSYLHYAEHLTDVKAWLETPQKTG